MIEQDNSRAPLEAAAPAESPARQAPPADTWDGRQLLAAFAAGAHWLEQHAEQVNALNVFPVPDGDTGTNMSLTMNGALDGIQPDSSCAVIADRVRYGATMRGRGNSGIILSQVLRGMAQGLADHELMGARELAAALVQASATAYKAVLKPVEGTMLTVIREASEAASAAAGAGAGLRSTLAAAAAEAGASVERTPSLLKTLRDAGVVDSGGRGLALLLEGMLRYAQGASIELDHVIAATAAPIAFEDIHGPDDFGYCTNFILQGSNLPFQQIREALAAMGGSAVIVGDEELVKVHLHTLMPGDALNYATQFGALTGIEITNMDLQREALHDGRPSATDEDVADREADSIAQAVRLDPTRPALGNVGVVAVAPGPGFAEIFRSLNAAAVVDGGATMNPSTEDLLRAIDLAPQSQVIMLPNNRNIILAARQAAQLSAKQVSVVPSRTVPQGVAAMLALNYQAGLEANTEAMTRALHDVRTSEITRAVRDATIDGVAVRVGQTIGLLDGDLVIADDDPDRVVDELLEGMELDEREIVAVYYGQGVSAEQAEEIAERVRQRFPDLEVEVRRGGQQLYDYILSAE